jgi:hypothetical protein
MSDEQAIPFQMRALHAEIVSLELLLDMWKTDSFWAKLKETCPDIEQGYLQWAYMMGKCDGQLQAYANAKRWREKEPIVDNLEYASGG